MKRVRAKNGFTLIEALVVTTIIAILIAIGFTTFKTQLIKGRDARRKADLSKLQKALEDRLNDAQCYPDDLVCNVDFRPYLAKVPCDPANNLYFNYFYSYDSSKNCKSWYKIYTRLENEKDPIIAKVGCEDGCGPGRNYNFWIGSPNVTEVTQLPGEIWIWPPEAAPAEGTPTPTEVPPVEETPTPTPTPVSAPAEMTPTPTPTPTTMPGSPQEGCLASGGTWQAFSNSCVDSCYLVSNPRTPCLAAMRMGCECGPSRCWDSESNACVPNPPTPTPTPTVVLSCQGGEMPTCWGGYNYYCLPNVCSSCCPGVEYRCNSAGDCCLPDTSCHL